MRYFTKLLFFVGALVTYLGFATDDVSFPFWKTVLIVLVGFLMMLPEFIKIIRKQVIE